VLNGTIFDALYDFGIMQSWDEIRLGLLALGLQPHSARRNRLQILRDLARRQRKRQRPGRFVRDPPSLFTCGLPKETPQRNTAMSLTNKKEPNRLSMGLLGCFRKRLQLGEQFDHNKKIPKERSDKAGQLVPPQNPRPACVLAGVCTPRETGRSLPNNNLMLGDKTKIFSIP
jgi:hypothetical protein